MDWSNITNLAAVALGFGLSELAAYLKGRKERRRRLYELRWRGSRRGQRSQWRRGRGFRPVLGAPACVSASRTGDGRSPGTSTKSATVT
ncbi:MAG: hypothetical protein RL685_7795, partial [Pseudomonadota bacterium]